MEVVCCLCKVFVSKEKVIFIAKALKDDDINEGLQSYIGSLVSIFFVNISDKI